MPLVKFLTLILPLIPQLVHLVEALFPPKSGNEKLAAVTRVITKVAERTPGLIAETEEIVNAARPLIEQSVKLMNDVKDTFKFPGQDKYS